MEGGRILAGGRELTIDNPTQTGRIDDLLPLVDDKFAELLETIDLRRNETFEAARDVVLGIEFDGQLHADLRGKNLCPLFRLLRVPEYRNRRKKAPLKYRT
ncbi:MAG: CHASE3 domain-containing protein [Chloroflexi bacterium]|nr:CHASE3 domain-containing protein [Chloroflexota bacterium]